jgi:hypothetical protein
MCKFALPAVVALALIGCAIGVVKWHTASRPEGGAEQVAEDRSAPRQSTDRGRGDGEWPGCTAQGERAAHTRGCAPR